MGSLVYVLAILGCADDGQLCEPVVREPVTFVSKVACMAAVQTRLPQYTNLSYPVVAARCEARGFAVADARTRPRG